MIEILSNKVVYEFSPNMKENYKVPIKKEIIVHTNDCFFQQINSSKQVLEEIDYEKLNPATGPIYVEGAEVGDILKIDIISIDVKDKGVAAIVPKEGVLGDKVQKPIIRVFDVVDGKVDLFGQKIPINPMIGVIGVGPAEKDGVWKTDSPWKHGGNMDTKDIKSGSSLYLPVNQKGAMLALGDCHGIMGDGELCFTGLEIPAVVRLKLDLIKDRRIEWPIVETDKEFMVIASGDDLDEAIYTGTDQVVKYIMEVLNLEFEEAYMMASLLVDIRISQLVDPKITIRTAIDKKIISMKAITSK